MLADEDQPPSPAKQARAPSANPDGPRFQTVFLTEGLTVQDHSPRRARPTAFRSFILRTVEHAVEIGRTLPHYWFRGQDAEYRNLTPGAFRDVDGQPIPNAEVVRWREKNAAMQFRRKAIPILASTRAASPGTDLTWLTLMQHHRVPTRLLDWSESVLVALYFAVTSNDSKNGELWAMKPDVLNEKTSGRAGLPPHDDPVLRFLASEGMGNRADVELRKLGLRSTPTAPLAFEPVYGNQRMIAQLSAFTIHPNPLQNVIDDAAGESVQVGPGDGPLTITEAIGDYRCLVRYRIPAERKGQILRDLRLLGLTERTLFADLDGVGRELVSELRQDEPPVSDPPECGGKIDGVHGAVEGGS